MLSFGVWPLIRIVMPSCMFAFPLSDLRNNFVAEAAHVVHSLLRRRAEQADIDRTHAKLRQRLDVSGVVGRTASEQTWLAVRHDSRPRRRAGQDAKRQRDLRRIASRLLR